jgi:hypothetical protein
MRSSILVSASATAELDPSSVSPDWILSGAPKAEFKWLAGSRDGTAGLVIWDCTAGRFEWHYRDDEAVVVISGEVFIDTGSGQEHRLGPGDSAFFPAGSSCVWRVPDRVRKVAVLHKNLPHPLGLGVRAWNKLLSVLRRRGRSSLGPALLLLLAAQHGGLAFGGAG